MIVRINGEEIVAPLAPVEEIAAPDRRHWVDIAKWILTIAYAIWFLEHIEYFRPIGGLMPIGQ